MGFLGGGGSEIPAGSPLEDLGKLGEGQFGRIDVRTDFIKQLESAISPLLFAFLADPTGKTRSILEGLGVGGDVPGLAGQSQLGDFLFGGVPIEQKQQGGPLDPNAFSIVGENGPEIIPPGNAEVIPLDDLLRKNTATQAAGPGAIFTSNVPQGAVPPTTTATTAAPTSSVPAGRVEPIPGTEPLGLPGQGVQVPGGFIPQINTGGIPLATGPVITTRADLSPTRAELAAPQAPFVDLSTFGLGSAGNTSIRPGLFLDAFGALRAITPAGTQIDANMLLQSIASQLPAGFDPATDPQFQEFLASGALQGDVPSQGPAPAAPTIANSKAPQTISIATTANSTAAPATATTNPTDPIDLPPIIDVDKVEGFQEGAANPSSGPGAIQNFLQQQAPEVQTFQQAQDLLFGPNGILGGGNSGQAIIDALGPLFERNLSSSLAQLTNAAPSVFGSGFGQAGSGLAQSALQDFNLLSAQALQQGQQNTLGGLGILGQLAGQAGQNPFQRLLGAGQLSQQQQQFESQFGLAQNQQQFNQAWQPFLSFLQSIFGFIGGPTGFQTVQGPQ